MIQICSFTNGISESLLWFTVRTDCLVLVVEGDLAAQAGLLLLRERRQRAHFARHNGLRHCVLA